jgi:hypothetical protein
VKSLRVASGNHETPVVELIIEFTLSKNDRQGPRIEICFFCFPDCAGAVMPAERVAGEVRALAAAESQDAILAERGGMVTEMTMAFRSGPGIPISCARR